MCRIENYEFLGVGFSFLGESVFCFRGIEFVLCFGQYVVGFVGVSVCCVLEILFWVWVREYELCVGQFVLGFLE